jgi:hypothetical protein
MKYLFVLLLAAMFFPVTLYSQGNYKTGYVITLKGDTIHGLLEEHTWDTNPTTVTFKSTATEKSQKFSTTDIRQFSIDGLETYKRYPCHISLGTTDENHLDAIVTTAKVDTVFLRELQTGKNVTLLSYTDDIKTRFYICEKSNDLPQELMYRVYLLTKTNAVEPSRSKTDYIFLQQLGALALKYGMLDDKLQKILNNTEYREAGLVKITAKINGINTPALPKKKISFTKLALAFLIVALFYLHAVHTKF